MKCSVTHKINHASLYAAKLHRQALAKAKGEVCNPYRCGHCCSWHVGHNRRMTDALQAPIPMMKQKKTVQLTRWEFAFWMAVSLNPPPRRTDYKTYELDEELCTLMANKIAEFAGRVKRRFSRSGICASILAKYSTNHGALARRSKRTPAYTNSQSQLSLGLTSPKPFRTHYIQLNISAYSNEAEPVTPERRLQISLPQEGGYGDKRASVSTSEITHAARSMRFHSCPGEPKPKLGSLPSPPSLGGGKEAKQSASRNEKEYETTKNKDS